MLTLSSLFSIFFLFTTFLRDSIPSYPFHPSISAQFHPICEIQGSGPKTPFEGDWVETTGTVIMDFDDQSQQGFFIQQTGCDGDPATSDGIFVAIDQQLDIISPGDLVIVEGTAQENSGLTVISADISDISVTGTANLPAAAAFSPPLAANPAAAYFEARESMRITSPAAIVIGPTNSIGETYLIDDIFGIHRVLQGDPAGAVLRVDDAGPQQIQPPAKVGDSALNLSGVLNETGGKYHIHLDANPQVLVAATPPTAVLPASSLRIASLNLHNLFDTFNDPTRQDPVLSTTAYQTKLQKLALTISQDLSEPPIIAVQEAENSAVLQALANRPEISIQYFFTTFNGPDRRGIDNGILYDPQQANMLSSQPRQGCTTLVDGLGPDGNQDPLNPQNVQTCTMPGQTSPTGNRLFSRPPLMASFEICDALCSQGGSKEIYWIIAVHLKSKRQDTSTVQYTLPRRIEQVKFLTGLVQEIQSTDPDAKVALLGDFNDYVLSQPLQALEGAGLVNLVRGVPRPERYTYIFDGISQALDHIFLNQNFLSQENDFLIAKPIHTNADFPAFHAADPAISRRASDHDPVMLYTIRLDRKIYLPIAANGGK